MADLSLFCSRHNLSASPPLQRIKECSILPGIGIPFCQVTSHRTDGICMLRPLETEIHSKITFCRLVLLILIFQWIILPIKHNLGSIHTIKHFLYLGVQNLHVFSPVSNTRIVTKGFQLFFALMHVS